MFKNGDLWRDIMRDGGVKMVAAAIGRDKSRIYRWAVDEPGLLDWFEALVELLGMRPGTRPTLIRMQKWSAHLFERALERHDVKPVSIAELHAKNVRLQREIADVLEQCPGHVSGTDRDRLIREALEAREVLSDIIAAAERGFVEEEVAPPRLRAAR